MTSQSLTFDTKHPSCFSFRVYLEDTDSFGMIYHGKYVNFFERGRTEWFRELGYELDDLLNKGIMFAVSNIHIQFLRPAKQGQVLTVNTKLAKLKLYLFKFEQQIIDSNGQSVATATVDVVSTDTMGKVQTLNIENSSTQIGR